MCSCVRVRVRLFCDNLIGNEKKEEKERKKRERLKGFFLRND